VSDQGSSGPLPHEGHLDQVIRGLRWIGVARLFVQLVTWSLTIFTVRLLEPRDYGVVATSGLFTILATMLMDGGLSVILISRRDLPDRVQGAATTGILLISLVLTGIVVAIAPLGAELFNNPALVNVLRVASLYIPLSALTVVPTALLSRALRFRELALAQGLPSVLQGLVTLGLAWSGAGYWSLIFGTLFGTAIRATVLWLTLTERPQPNLDLASLRSLWSTGSQMVGQRLLYFAAQDFDTFMLGRLAGPAVLGSYSLAKTLSHTALEQLAGVVNQVSLPAFAAKSNDRNAQVNGLSLMVLTVSTLVFPLFWLTCVLSRTALPLLFGDRWTPMVLPFMAFTFMLPFRSVYALLDSAVVGTGQVSTTLRNMLTWAAVMMPLIFISAHFGADWTATSWCVGLPIVLLVAIRRIARVFRVTVWQLLKPMRAPLLASLASAVVTQVVILRVRSHTPLAAQLVIGASLGLLCYVLLMRQYARPHYQNACNLAGRLLRF
jgi:teichuronic acid exporter